MELTALKLKLSSIRQYNFSATSNKNDGWKGFGQGTVSIEENELNKLIFFEEGHFESAKGKFKSHNVYRWTFKPLENIVSLEHLRFGLEKPIYLFDMACEQNNLWLSQCPHLCDKDEYHAKMIVENSLIKLEWDILNKDDLNHIEYNYSF